MSPPSSLALAAQLLVSAGSLASVLLAGRRRPGGVPRFPRAPWFLLVGAHGTFLAYALVSGQVGFLPLNVGMVLAGLLNLRASHRAARPPTTSSTAASVVTATLTATVAPSGAP